MNESSKVGHVVSGVKLASVAVKGTDAVFPVRRIYLVGRNYAEHAKEMGHDPERESLSSSKSRQTRCCLAAVIFRFLQNPARFIMKSSLSWRWPLAVAR